MPNTPNASTPLIVKNTQTYEESLYNLGGKIVSPLMPVAGSNLQNAMENFEYARKNKDATIIDYYDFAQRLENNIFVGQE